MTSKSTSKTGLLPGFVVDDAVKSALKEDLGRAGDITTNATIPENLKGEGIITARKSGVVAGLQFAGAAFLALDNQAQFLSQTQDGACADAGDTIAMLTCNARALLAGERVALNFLGHLSGIATLTNKFVEAVRGTNAQICCTRKTTPGLRAAEKYAVRAGGGTNHRFGLDDAVLIKDNHIALAGGIEKAIELALRKTGHMMKVEVEVDTLDQLEIALKFPIDAVLLDNMAVDQLSKAVDLIDGRVVAEASGNVSLETVNDIANTGVDLISVGSITHSAPNLDVGLDFAASNT